MTFSIVGDIVDNMDSLCDGMRCCQLSRDFVCQAQFAKRPPEPVTGPFISQSQKQKQMDAFGFLDWLNNEGLEKAEKLLEEIDHG